MLDNFREYVVEGLDDDWLYFAELMWIAHQVNPGDDELQQARDAAVHFIRDGLIVPGNISDSGFQPWRGSPDDWALRIEREVGNMLAVKVEPRMGEICWFDLRTNLSGLNLNEMENDRPAGTS